MNDIATNYPGLAKVVFSEDEIAERVQALAGEVDAFYAADEGLLVVGLLKGAFMFVSDLVRAIGRPTLEVDFLTAALYGEGTDSHGTVQLVSDLQTSVKDRNVLLVEDVIDSGKTLNRVGDELSHRAPRSLEVCALLHKGLSTDLRYEPRWVGFDAPPDWLVGYGLDLGERYRHLPFIGALVPEDKRGF